MKKLFLAALALAIMAGCTKDNNMVEMPSENELLISSSIQTRVANDVWESGDSIGIFMRVTGSEYEDWENENVPYTTIYGDGNFTSDAPLFFPLEETVYILAYYPYKENFEPVNPGSSTMYFPIDVTDQSDLNTIDILVAKQYNIENTTDAVEMTFSHRLSFLSLTISAGNGMTTEELEGLEVVVSGLRAIANVGIFSSVISFPYNPIDITLNTASSGTLAEAVVIPMSNDGYPTLYFKTKAGDTYSTIIPISSFASGKKYDYNITLNKAGVQISSSNISTWGDGSEGESNLSAEPVSQE